MEGGREQPTRLINITWRSAEHGFVCLLFSLNSIKRVWLSLGLQMFWNSLITLDNKSTPAMFGFWGLWWDVAPMDVI